MRQHKAASHQREAGTSCRSSQHHGELQTRRTEHGYVMKIGRSSTRMNNDAPARIGFSRRSGKADDDASQRSRSSVRASAVTQPLIFKPSSSCTVCIVLILATTYSIVISAQGTFSLGSTSFSCSSNLICVGDAHVYTDPDNSNIQIGSLSLLSETLGAGTLVGVAYYHQQVRLVDPSTQQSASFSTSFTIDNVWGSSSQEIYGTGDGMTFVISGDGPPYIGHSGGQFGIFNSDSLTPNQSIVVEFDSFYNPGEPCYDISENHISFDFSRLQYAAAKNASDVQVYLNNTSTVYAWVEYTKETQQLEARLSNVNTRPNSPLLHYTVDLFEVVNEYMWVGFSSSASDWHYSNFYVGDWTFNWTDPTDPTAPTAPPSSITGTAGPGRSRPNKLGIIVGISVGVPTSIIICILIALCTYGICACRGDDVDEELGDSNSTRNDPNFQIQGMPERFGYKQLSIATKGFSTESKLGQGGFGSVYRGVLPSSGIPVAVKKISCDSNQGEKEFMTEVSTISQLRHRNLIQLLGWCVDSSKGYYLLVYELMPNGSLDQALFGLAEKGLAPLSWHRRLKIVIGIASALEYLHHGWKQQVIHRDIKSSNIMLDEDWNAMLGDFGFARLYDHAQTPVKTLVAGTIGYIAPEGVASGIFTERTDVFAFGVVVLEMACGRPALSTNVPPNEMVLVDWVWESLSAGDLLSTMDKRPSDYHKESMEVLLKVGLLCSHPNPEARPSMRRVVQVLVGEAPMPLIPTSKPTLLFNSDS